MNKNRYPQFKEMVPRWQKPQMKLRKKILRGSINLLAWIGVAVLYYFGFSFFLDTPVEYEMKQSTRKLRDEYTKLYERYDSLERVLENVKARDKQVFKTLFESEPYNFDADLQQKRGEEHEELFSKTNKELGQLFFGHMSSFESGVMREWSDLRAIGNKIDSIKDQMDFIPAIQPVMNPELTLLTASYGMRYHPFYKTLTSHQGVDYTVSEGTRVFATADGWIKDVISRNTSSGNTVVINHFNGYETAYSHLGEIYVQKGQTVRRGEIIAQSGNTGLSLGPHLHYEVRHNQMRVDPIHYFFLELDYNDYQKMIKIAQSGMQSFD